MTKEALKLAQEPSATRPCRSCGGTGERWTGINEAPTSICKPCNGTGQIALAKPAQDVDYWIREATAARQAEMAMRRELEAQPAQEPVTHLWECLGRWSAYLVENGKQADCAPPSWLVDAINKATTPPLPEQEPVAIRLSNGMIDVLGGALVPIGTLLYLTPPQRSWVGLTEKEAKSFIGFYKMDIARLVEAKLKEKNT